LRGNYPKITIIVHPECDEQVVKNSDISGSTSRIYNEIKKSSSGSIWGVGTEYHFIQRIAAEFSDKIILPLKESICSDMALIKPDKLLKSLQQIQNLLNRNVTASNKTSSQNIILERIVQVDEHMKLGAAKALKKMIEIVEN
jgi:quinolinate synthase